MKQYMKWYNVLDMLKLDDNNTIAISTDTVLPFFLNSKNSEILYNTLSHHFLPQKSQQ